MITPPAPPVKPIKITGIFNKVLHHEGVAQHEDAVLSGVDVIVDIQVLAGAFGVIGSLVSD